MCLVHGIQSSILAVRWSHSAIGSRETDSGPPAAGGVPTNGAAFRDACHVTSSAHGRTIICRHLRGLGRCLCNHTRLAVKLMRQLDSLLY